MICARLSSARFANVCAIALSNQIADHFYVFYLDM